MGLDTVEMLMAFEAAFDLRIPNTAAERMQTVRDVIDHVASRKSTVPSTRCSTQQTFHALRRALPRPARRIVPRTRLAELANRKTWPPAWKRARAVGGGDWPTTVPWKSWHRDGPETVGELVLYVTARQPRADHPRDDPWTRDEITHTVRRVIFEQQGIWRVFLGDSFVADLGLD